MKKVQDNNPSTEIKPLSNSGSIMSYIKDQSFLYNPEKLDWRNRLIYTLFSWASLDTSLDIVQFCMEYKMHRRTLYKWSTAYNDIKEALDDIKVILGCRRRIGALTRRFDKDVAFKDMHMYDPEWLEINKYHAALKKEEGGDQGGIRVVEIQSAPHTGKIKKKEKADE